MAIVAAEFGRLKATGCELMEVPASSRRFIADQLKSGHLFTRSGSSYDLGQVWACVPTGKFQPDRLEEYGAGGLVRADDADDKQFDGQGTQWIVRPAVTGESWATPILSILVQRGYQLILEDWNARPGDPYVAKFPNLQFVGSMAFWIVLGEENGAIESCLRRAMSWGLVGYVGKGIGDAITRAKGGDERHTLTSAEALVELAIIGAYDGEALLFAEMSLAKP